MRVLLPFLAALLQAVHSSFTAQCFTTKFDYGISRSEPVAELWQVTVTDCLNYCIFNAAKSGDGCAAVVYHKEYASCQLYGHDGTLGESQIVAAVNHDYYNRTSYIGACQDRVPPKRGYQQRPRQYSFNTVQISENGHVLAKSQEIYSKEAPAVLSDLISRLPVNNKAVEQLQNKHLTDLLDLEAEIPEENTVTFYNPTKTNVCSKREVISYFVLFGLSLSAAVRPSRLRGVDQSSCIMYCSQNINSTGASVPCYAANYDPAKEECRLYGRTAKADRHSARLAKNDNIIFADKFCIESKKDCSAESPYIVYLRKQITKKIVAHYPDIHSIVACMAICIDNPKCKAVTYKRGGLCILHGSSPATDPSLLEDGTEQTMAVENGCQTSARSVPSLLSGAMEAMSAPSEEATPWGEWSACQFGTPKARLRSRTRDCFVDNCEDLQMEPCN